MKVIVQKFGGTSLKSEDGRNRAVNHIKDAVKDGYKVVVVVSAMGRFGDPYATDTLLGLIGDRKRKVTSREYDLLVSCGESISSVVFSNMLLEENLKATAYTGGQAGFITTGEHSKARILEMRTERLSEELKAMDVVVVTGFQGITEKGDVTTLGRGGSDTSAAALGAALSAEWVDIFTDVEGIMTADPRLVEKARPLSIVTYNEVCNMAYQGAKVIHPRAVEIAMQSKVPLRIRSTYSSSTGTLVTSMKGNPAGEQVVDRLITGIAHVNGVSQIKVFAKEGQYDLQSKVFKAMALEGISVDFINISPTGVVYTVMEEMTEKAVETLNEMGYDPVIIKNCAKVSAVGAGMSGVPGVTSKIVEALAGQNIDILQSADSHTTIWVLVKQSDLSAAVNALHETFYLHLEPGTEEVEPIMDQR
ncbi:aspartate kinase [Guptibacillus algicola]|uniref:aspartate kinase n=1 Tax=Guptibacillus algicola TaxID=225844 RepID=UPI001CD3CCBC|nr:aspartate kinase [Alkalihalobacillus algicola]MCA0988095.1 aspartate kinase [Alkalihalobacillus algicola]